MVENVSDFGEDPKWDALVERADRLVEQDRLLMRALVKHRQESGLTQEDVEERLGWAPGSAYEFEVYYSDPSLSEIRRYALAINADVTHSVSFLEDLHV